MAENNGPSGEALLILATLVSLQLAQGRSSDDLVLIAAFFEVLGDNLALIAARRDMSAGSRCKESVNSVEVHPESI